MIKPIKLKRGDYVATISLSNGMAGEKIFRHRYELGKKRLEQDFGLRVVATENSLNGIEYLSQHPEKRAKDLMNAFENPEIKAIICNIGGDDTVRLLPYIDFNIIHNNPKIFMGYSDTTVNHFMMYRAGLVSYYGPAVMSEFAENCKMHDYTKKYIKEVLFENKDKITIASSPEWTSEFLDWCNESNDNIYRKMNKETHGYELIQGKTIFEGILLGGCIDVFPMLIGTEIWPKKEEWENKILYLETSENEVKPTFIEYILRNLIVQGIIDKINGIIVGKPKNEKYYEEYKEVYHRLIGKEAKRPDLPILFNVNFGHTAPMCILPNGIKVRVDFNNKEIIFLERPMSDIIS